MKINIDLDKENFTVAETSDLFTLMKKYKNSNSYKILATLVTGIDISKAERYTELRDTISTLNHKFPLWILNYKEFFENIKINSVIFNKRKITNRAEIKAVLNNYKFGRQAIGIEAIASHGWLPTPTSFQILIDALIENKNENYTFSLCIATYKHVGKKIAPFTEHYIIDYKNKKLLKHDSNFLKIFKTNFTIRNFLELDRYLEGMIEFIKKYSDVIKPYIIITRADFRRNIYFINDLYYFKDSKTVLEKILEKLKAKPDDRKYDYIELHDDYLFFDYQKVADQFEIFEDVFMTKDTKEFIKNLKQFDKCKTINQALIKNLSKIFPTIYDHQKLGISWLYCLYNNKAPGAILADDMGLGKTMQTIAFLSTLKSKKIAIIAPASVTNVWRNEIEKFNPDILRQNKIEIYSYEKFNTSGGKEYDIIILDEAQKVKNSNTVMYRRIFETKRKFTLIVTGTPIENGVNDLINLLALINYSFRSLFSILKSLYGKNQDKLLVVLRKIVDEIYLQRKKDIIKGIKDIKLNIIPVKFKLTDKELKLYKQIETYLRKELNRAIAQTHDEFYIAQVFFVILLKLRQFTSYPGQLKDALPEHIIKACQTIEPSKYKETKKIVDKHIKKGEKVVIFSQFLPTIEFLKNKFSQYGVLTLTGNDSQAVRNELVEKFQTDNKYKIFIISLKAGNSGLTLTSANNVIIYDLWYNPQVIAQAIARVHRIGQTKDVNAYFMIAKDTFDERIYEIVYEKQDIIKKFENPEATKTSNPDSALKELKKVFLK